MWHWQKRNCLNGQPSKNKNNERKPEFDVICKLWNSDRRDRTEMSCFLPSFISLNVSLLFVSGGIVVGWLLCRQWWMIRNKKSIIGETVSYYYFSLDSSLHVTNTTVLDCKSLVFSIYMYLLLSITFPKMFQLIDETWYSLEVIS